MQMVTSDEDEEETHRWRVGCNTVEQRARKGVFGLGRKAAFALPRQLVRYR